MATPAHIFKTARRQLRKISRRGAYTEKEKAILASADRQRAMGLGWRYDGFAGTSTQEILERLSEIGIGADEASFRQEALAAGTPTKLGEQWLARCTAEGRWADYPHLAARELWARLLADEIRAEVVSDRIDALLELAEVESEERKKALWHDAALILTDACIRGGEPDRELFAAILKESGCDLTGWMSELPPLLMGTEFQEDAPRLCRDFAHFTDGPALLAERAEILLRLGDAEGARAEISALLAKHPDQPAVLLKAGGIYEALGNQPEAQRCLAAYQEAMEKQRRAAQSAQAAGRMRPGVIPLSALALKAEPNAPCPCGSGKKFKHCHGLTH